MLFSAQLDSQSCYQAIKISENLMFTIKIFVFNIQHVSYQIIVIDQLNMSMLCSAIRGLSREI